MKYNYQLDSFKMSCNEELVNVEAEMYKVEQGLKRLKDTPAVERLLHHSKIKQRRAWLEKSYAEYAQRRESLLLEQEVYKRYGLNIPSGPEFDRVRKLVEARHGKLEIVEMIDCGLM